MGIIIFFFIALSMYDVMEDYSNNIAAFPSFFFIGFVFFYIKQLGDYIKLIADIELLKLNNNKDDEKYIPNKNSKRNILYINLSTIVMTLFFISPVIYYSSITNSFDCFITHSYVYILFAFLLNDKLIQMIKEKTILQNNN